MSKSNLSARIKTALHVGRIAAEKAALNAYCEASKAAANEPRAPRPRVPRPPGAMKAWHR
jgi:hypothetical protein